MGSHRTDIARAMMKYLGDQQDWRALNAGHEDLECHAVEVGMWFYDLFDGGIASNPVDLLEAQLHVDDETDIFWIPRSEVRASVYAPIKSSKPASLLWGRHLGFAPRCSREITTIPSHLLT